MQCHDGRAVPAAEVVGVHGATGRTTWLQLARGHAITGPWEAVELAAVPPGGVSGVHRHTRTVELYFVIEGSGVLSLNGTDVPVHPNWIAFVGLGDRHGLSGSVASGVRWLVLEAPAPSVVDVVRERPTMSPTMPPGPRVPPLDLAAAVHLDLRGRGLDPLQSVELVDLAAGDETALRCSRVELFLYLLDGVLRIEGDDHSPPIELRAGDSLTLALGEHANVRAAAASRYFLARVAVTQR